MDLRGRHKVLAEGTPLLISLSVKPDSPLAMNFAGTRSLMMIRA